MNAERLPPLIRALMQAGNPLEAAQVRLIETHISWVLLAGEHVYKIKKPVDLGFLDFSTLEQRHQACIDEVRLNRRLEPDIYLGVVSISGSVEQPELGGSGMVVEYAVKMRRFPSDATLDRLDLQGGLGIEQIDQLAVRLAHFHLSECATAPVHSPWGEPDAIARPIAENFRLLEERLDDTEHRHRLAVLQDWSNSAHQRLLPLMRERKRDGMVRECHGDLHLGNLAWVDQRLVIFDCIEFNAALRWIDVISEVAFCYMDLLHRRHRDLALRFVNAWLERTGDYAGVALLRYYAVYRALVRAKVAALRAGQPGSDAAACHIELEECLQLAAELTQAVPPQLWITHGLSGSGKTTLSQSLLQRHGMIRLRSDVERKRLAGLDALAHTGAGMEEGVYAPDFSRRTYVYLAQQAEELIAAGWPVLVDATFLARWQRDLLRELALRHNAPFRIIDLQVELATLRERIGRRTAQGNDASEAGLSVLEQQIETQQPLDEDELEQVLSQDEMNNDLPD